MSDRSESDYAWFRSQLASFLPNNRGKHALLHKKSVAEFFPTSLEAIKSGRMRFGDGNFTVEVVDDRVEDLGFYSHVNTALRA